MSKKFILSLDQGTTGTRAFIFDDRGKAVASAYQEFKQYYPHPGWVEHDADEIWRSCESVIKRAIRQGRLSASQIVAVGITNQRETTVIWDRRTSRPVHKAIVWQCRRSAPLCAQLAKKGLAAVIRRKTGLVLDAYFSATKIKWLLDHVPGLRARAAKGQVCFGTMDSWLIWKLTAGQSHTTDMTNASRTMIFNIRKLKWDEQLLKVLGIPAAILPQVRNSGTIFGYVADKKCGLQPGTPITAVMGDQQAALYGQGCYEPGTIKNTYGTGCFIMLNTGKKLIYSKNGLLTTVAANQQGAPVYALEGAVFIAGAVMQWLRDELRVIKNSAESEKLIAGLKDTNGVYFVPAFVGLGAPYWDSAARGTITGLTRGANVRHLVRAALESIAYQTRDVFELMQGELNPTRIPLKKIKEMRVDGGACRNDFLMQFQADMLDCKIVRPKMIESTAQGVALLAGVTLGIWSPRKDLTKLHKIEKVFSPKMKEVQRQELYRGWLKAVAQARC